MWPLTLLHRSGDRLRSLALWDLLHLEKVAGGGQKSGIRTIASQRQHQAEQAHRQPGQALQGDQGQGQQVLDQVGIGRRGPGGCGGCGHQFCWVRPTTCTYVVPAKG